MTPEQIHAKTQRLMAHLAARGLPQDGGFATVAEPDVYPNAAFGELAGGGYLQVNFPGVPTAAQAWDVQAASQAWDDSNEAQAAFDRQKSRVDAGALLNSDEPMCVVIRALARVVHKSVGAIMAKLGQPPRTWDQLVAAVQAEIDAGNADA